MLSHPIRLYSDDSTRCTYKSMRLCFTHNLTRFLGESRTFPSMLYNSNFLNIPYYIYEAIHRLTVSPRHIPPPTQQSKRTAAYPYAYQVLGVLQTLLCYNVCRQISAQSRGMSMCAHTHLDQSIPTVTDFRSDSLSNVEGC